MSLLSGPDAPDAGQAPAIVSGRRPSADIRRVLVPGPGRDDGRPPRGPVRGFHHGPSLDRVTSAQPEGAGREGIFPYRRRAVPGVAARTEILQLSTTTPHSIAMDNGFIGAGRQLYASATLGTTTALPWLIFSIPLPGGLRRLQTGERKQRLAGFRRGPAATLDALIRSCPLRVGVARHPVPPAADGTMRKPGGTAVRAARGGRAVTVPRGRAKVTRFPR